MLIPLAFVEIAAELAFMSVILSAILSEFVLISALIPEISFSTLVILMLTCVDVSSTYSILSYRPEIASKSSTAIASMFFVILSVLTLVLFSFKLIF